MRRRHVATGVSLWLFKITTKPRMRRQMESMSTFTKLAYHIVFSTKYRHRLIHAGFQKRLYEYIGGIIRAQNGHLIEVGGIEDHIHLLATLSPTKAISDSIREIKTNASKWSNDLPDQTRLERPYRNNRLIQLHKIHMLIVIAKMTPQSIVLNEAVLKMLCKKGV